VRLEERSGSSNGQSGRAIQSSSRRGAPASRGWGRRRPCTCTRTDIRRRVYRDLLGVTPPKRVPAPGENTALYVSNGGKWSANPDAVDTLPPERVVAQSVRVGSRTVLGSGTSASRQAGPVGYAAVFVAERVGQPHARRPTELVEKKPGCRLSAAGPAPSPPGRLPSGLHPHPAEVPMPGIEGPADRRKIPGGDPHQAYAAACGRRRRPSG